MCCGGEGVVLRCRTVWIAACRGNIAVWGGGVPVFLEFLDDVPRHGDVKCLLFVIPLESNPTVEITVPIYGEFIFLLDACDEVVNIFLTFVFYIKIIDDQREGDGPGCVFPKTWGLFALKVSVGGKAFLE